MNKPKPRSFQLVILDTDHAPVMKNVVAYTPEEAISLAEDWIVKHGKNSVGVNTLYTRKEVREIIKEGFRTSFPMKRQTCEPYVQEKMIEGGIHNAKHNDGKFPGRLQTPEKPTATGERGREIENNSL